MPQQWNQWEISLKIEPQYGRYWGDLPNTQRVNFPPTDTWAYTYLSSLRVYEEHQSELAFGQISFVNYDFMEYGVVTRSVDVSHPDYTFNKTNFISSYDMVGLTIEWLGRNVGARGLAIIEFWSEPKTIAPYRARDHASSSSMMPMVGRGIKLSDFHIVALHDPETGEVVAHHTFATIMGGKPISESEAIESALANARRHHEAMRKSESEMAYLKARGLKVLPIEQLAVKVANDVALLGSPLRVHSKTGKIEALDESVRTSAPKGSTHTA